MEQKDFEQLLAKIEKKRKICAKHNNELFELLDIRNGNCPHTETTDHSAYNGGGYDYTDYTEYWTTCNCCGQSSERVRKDHGSYA